MNSFIYRAARLGLWGGCVLCLSMASAAASSPDANPDALPEWSAVTVTATRVPLPDQVAPYASEVHTREDIQRSGATSLFDYMSRNSSVLVAPSFGNRMAPMIDMRGYGQNDGYQNMVITLNGRRLNNIDQVSQLLGAISLVEIESIEITKGSGAVMFGDGAMAGTIQIKTRPVEGGKMGLILGSQGQMTTQVAMGHRHGPWSLGVSAETQKNEGTGQAGPDGFKDSMQAQTWNAELAWDASPDLQLKLYGGKADLDSRFINSLTLAQYQQNPSQFQPPSYDLTAKGYTRQTYSSEPMGVSMRWQLAPAWELNTRYDDEAKRSNFVNSSGPSLSNYRYQNRELVLQHQQEAWLLNVGVQGFDGVRQGSSGRVSKANAGVFAHLQYQVDAWTLAAGWRHENVDYVYTPNAGTAGSGLDGRHSFKVFEAGVNRALSPQDTVFLNYNQGFQAPDIDRFFTYAGAFNGYIQPATARTWTLGTTHQSPQQRLKANVFYAHLNNEIYYDAITFNNTNIERSHKWGVELQEHYRFNAAWAARLNYTYTQAIMDEVAQSAGAYNGKNLPGVSPHTAIMAFDWRLDEQQALTLSGTWRARAYASEDFSNSANQMQTAYRSVDLSYRLRMDPKTQLYLGVQNLLAYSNGIWVRDDAIYPVDFSRSWRVGLNLAM